ncbi:Protein rhomboid [Amphibalanus amphitrite]|uniref:rhomboid protease n=2 Tax=Amphibalanus amphitrite TaxID=1232801 RepID=A0A6A4W6Q5_AMPAM|nr:protein rhomboid-like isoform X2 [Amphibalanus amphitrite]XP_043201270.1 protein rhomboid-like isoform X2 [Amphibalanus amphitrite]XP_043206347.1 protein rhomboid-like [Amphibalanus amphitrite]KAF0300919.1 Protein rhomboid [Amphibalanus amphitrite]
MTGKRTRSFKCAVHHRDREVRSENDFHLITKPISPFQRMVKMVADEYLTDERDRKYYADHYRCCPPPLFIISVTLLELGFFIYYTVTGAEDVAEHGGVPTSVSPVPIDSVLLYRPDRRWQLWRFFTYMVLHASWWHLIFNLLVQLVVGLPLEMVHGSCRVLTVYMAGVLAGSLGTSVCDAGRQVYLVGASGGVYALLAAHIANVLLNYHNMEFGIFRLLIVFLIASFDVGFAIYHRFSPLPAVEPAVSYVAHLAGAAAGLTLGLVVLKNFQQKLHEQLVWWLALGTYLACTMFAVIFNIMHTPLDERIV